MHQYLRHIDLGGHFPPITPTRERSCVWLKPPRVGTDREYDRSGNFCAFLGLVFDVVCAWCPQAKEVTNAHRRNTNHSSKVRALWKQAGASDSLQNYQSITERKNCSCVRCLANKCTH